MFDRLALFLDAALEGDLALVEQLYGQVRKLCTHWLTEIIITNDWQNKKSMSELDEIRTFLLKNPSA